MEAKLEKQEKNRVWAEVKVEVEETGFGFKQAYRKLSESVTIPGFRKGKVPPDILKRRVGEAAILAEALEILLPQFYLQAVDKLKLKPIDRPKVELVSAREGEDLVFKFEVEVKPEVKVENYLGVEAKRISAEVTEEEVKEQVDILRNRFATLKPTKSRPIKKGDFVLMSFTGKINGQVLESATAQDFVVELGQGYLMPGFEDKIYGAKPGDVLEFSLTFDEDYFAKEVAGKTVDFQVIIKELKEKVLPEASDEFAKQVGAYNSLEELKEKLKEQLGLLKKQQSESLFREAVLSQVVEWAEVEVPETLINRQIEEMIRLLDFRVRREGLTLERYLEETGKTIEDLRNEFRSQAEQTAKTELVLEKIAEKEGLKVTEKDIDEEIELLARRTGASKEQLKEEMTRNNEMPLLEYDILLKKTLNYLVENAKEVKIKTETKNKTKKEREVEKSGTDTDSSGTDKQG